MIRKEYPDHIIGVCAHVLPDARPLHVCDQFVSDVSDLSHDVLSSNGNEFVHLEETTSWESYPVK